MQHFYAFSLFFLIPAAAAWCLYMAFVAYA